jgi:ATP-dependent RNA helicase DeaD
MRKEPMQSAPFSELGLSPELLKAVEQMGFQEASPIQTATIPLLLAGKDVAGLSRTGSGKTAAFAIPAVQSVTPQLRAPQVLILCPTRELAVQIAGEVAKLSAYSRGVRELAIYGGQSYGIQYRGIEDGAQIIAGTPGRLMDHLERGSLSLEHIRLIVLDEADRMLDMGFRDDIATILQQAPEARQTAFFSATMPSAVEQLIRLHTRDPQWVRLETRAEAAPNIDQSYYDVAHGSRSGALCRVLEATNLRFGIIFCSTKSSVDGVTEHLLSEGYQADRLHGDMSQAMRERVMRRFRDGKLEFLVATDVAARGIDVDDVEAVINYDIPRDPEDYVHRIGRTGRAGRSGKAITFVTSREIYALDRIQRLTRVKIRRERMPTASEAAHRKAEEMAKLASALIQNRKYPSNNEIAKMLLAEAPAEAAVEALLYLLTNRKSAIAKARNAEHPEKDDHAGTAQPPLPPKNRTEHPTAHRNENSARRDYDRIRSRSKEGSSFQNDREQDRPHARESRERFRSNRPSPTRSTLEPREPNTDFPKDTQNESRSSRPFKSRRPAPENTAPAWIPKKSAQIHPKTGAPRPPRNSPI